MLIRQKEEEKTCSLLTEFHTGLWVLRRVFVVQKHQQRQVTKREEKRALEVYLMIYFKTEERKGKQINKMHRSAFFHIS
jgi:hypothetical protein